MVAYLFNSPLHGGLSFHITDILTVYRTPPVRHLTDPQHSLIPSKPLFVVEGAPNVILETIKRGEDDEFEKTKTGGKASIVLRLYEAFGGHAKAKLKMPSHLRVARVHVTNLLEDEGGEELPLTRDVAVIDLRGFEVKTIKVELAPIGRTAG